MSEPGQRKQDREQGAERVAASGKRTAIPAATILVVDDHAPSRQFLMTLLGYKEHRLLEASDGVEALAIARAEHPDLILSDVLMPTMDGYEFVRKLRSDPNISRTKVVFCTAVYHVEEARALAAACSVLHTICKPAEPESVLQIVNAALSEKPLPALVAVPEEFDREHLKLVNNKLFKKVSELEGAKLQNAEILDIARLLASERNSQDLLEHLCLAVRKLTGARFAAIGLTKPGETVLQSFFVAGLDAQIMERLQPRPISSGILEQICQSRQPVRVADSGSDPITAGFPPAHGFTRPCLSVPLNSGAALYGVLYLVEKLGADSFSEHDEAMAVSLAAQAVVNYENHRRQEDLKQYALNLELQIAQRKQIEERTYLLSRAVEGSHELIGIADCDGQFTYANDAFLQVLGFSSKKLMGQHFAAVLSRNNPATLNEQIGARSYEAGGWKGECLMAREDGSDLQAYLRTSQVRDEEGRLLGSVGIAEDISERKRSELELFRAKEAAELANRAKSEFLANMSHEIRTPMNGILGMTGLLLETELTAEQSEYLHMVKGSADGLLTILNDILDFSKIEAGKLELDYLSFSLRKSLAETVRTLAIRAQQKGLELIFDIRPDVPDSIIGDPARLRQVLVNLVGNSIKFTERGEIEVTVRLDKVSADGTVLRFSIRDTGIGIAEDKQDKIFGAFSQADSSTTRKYGGTGLGLTICAQLVGLMGGKISVESTEGRGATFHFTVRVGRDATPLLPDLLDPASLAGISVLIVDDNATNRRIFEDSVRHWKMLPTAVNSAAAAIEALRRANAAGVAFPLVLTDAHMPEQDGFELVECIRKDPSMANTRIVLLTSNAARGDATRSQKLGVAAYLSKPFDRLELRDVLLRVLAGPAVKPEGQGLVTRHSISEQQKSLSFLVAEDNLVNQRLTARLLEKRGHSVVLVQNGLEVLKALETRAFDIILMDGQMPEMDGFEATKRIREIEKVNGGHLPIVALTALAMKGDEQRCFAAGMDGYVSKPIKSEELFSVIENVVPGIARRPGIKDTPSEEPHAPTDK